MGRMVTCLGDDLEPRDDRRAVDRCECCGEDIYAGEGAYHIDGDTFCESCVEDWSTDDWLELVHGYHFTLDEDNGRDI